MTPVDMQPPTDNQLKLALATIVTGLLTLIGLAFRRSGPVLVDHVVKDVVKREFAMELATIPRLEKQGERLAADVAENTAALSRIEGAQDRMEETLREFSRAIGRLEGSPPGVRAPHSLMTPEPAPPVRRGGSDK